MVQWIPTVQNETQQSMLQESTEGGLKTAIISHDVNGSPQLAAGSSIDCHNDVVYAGQIWFLDNRSVATTSR